MQSQPNGDHRKMVRTRFPGIYRRGSKYAVTFRDSDGRQRKATAPTLEDARVLKRTSETLLLAASCESAPRSASGRRALNGSAMSSTIGSAGIRP